MSTVLDSDNILNKNMRNIQKTVSYINSDEFMNNMNNKNQLFLNFLKDNNFGILKNVEKKSVTFVEQLEPNKTEPNKTESNKTEKKKSVIFKSEPKEETLRDDSKIVLPNDDLSISFADKLSINDISPNEEIKSSKMGNLNDKVQTIINDKQKIINSIGKKSSHKQDIYDLTRAREACKILDIKKCPTRKDDILNAILNEIARITGEK